MKKQITKKLFVLLTSIVFTVPSFAQGVGGHDYRASVKDEGGNWETFHFPLLDEDGNPTTVDGKNYYDVDYYIGTYYDRFYVNRLLGHHWKGYTIDELSEGEEIFLCNVETGEYLQVGDYWGESSMTNHAGIEYVLEPAKMIRKFQNWPAFSSDDEDEDGYHGYWIVPKLAGSASLRCVGRMNVYDGKQGHFERNGYLALRNKDEYHDNQYYNYNESSLESGDLMDSNTGNQNPGGFLFKFHEVKKDGKNYYIIYTHRQTNTVGETDGLTRSEYWDRDSYLLLRSAGRECGRTG